MTVTVLGAEVSVGTPTGPGAEDPLSTNVTPTVATVTLSVAPTAVSVCQSLVISWTVANMSGIEGTTLDISYSNIGVLQTGNGTTYDPPAEEETIANVPLSQTSWTWDPVLITEPGFYVIKAIGDSDPPPLVKQSSPFLVKPGLAPCPSFPPPIATAGSNSTPSPGPSGPTASSSSPPGSKIGLIVGGTIAGVAVVGLIGAFLLFRRRRSVVAKNVHQRQGSGKGHRKWGGLPSIDKIEGEIPVVMPPKSPHESWTYTRTHLQLTGQTMADKEGPEKGYKKDIFPVDADLVSEIPSIRSNRASRRYSSNAVNAVQRASGSAAFSHEHSRKSEPTPAMPVLSTTTATSRGNEDPFSDAAFMARGNRSSSLSVPSTARAPSRVSDISTREPPSPLAPSTPVQSQPISRASTMTRNPSAPASVGRPSRKPVPQYTDDPIELGNTNRSSPTSQTFPSRHGSSLGLASSVADLSSSATSFDPLASSVDSVSHWLHDRRPPIPNRNIGLAGQGDGPVHYLIPDLPPPPPR